MSIFSGRIDWNSLDPKKAHIYLENLSIKMDLYAAENDSLVFNSNKYPKKVIDGYSRLRSDLFEFYRSTSLSDEIRRLAGRLETRFAVNPAAAHELIMHN